MQIINLLR